MVNRYPRSDTSRDRILQAAIREFSEHGLAGARTSAIAAAARVNKALLYYYFRDKEGLYTAALEEVAGTVAANALAILELDCSPGERLLRLALQHFDRILAQQGFQALLQQEMVRYRHRQPNAMQLIAKKAFEPMFGKLRTTAEEGILNGELCSIDWLQMMYTAIGTNVFYFLSAPMMSMILPVSPLEPSAIAERRRSNIECLGQAFFVDRRRGARIAHRVLETTPIPEIGFAERKTA